MEGIGKGRFASRNEGSLGDTGQGKERVTEYGAQGWERWKHSIVEFEGMEVEK